MKTLTRIRPWIASLSLIAALAGFIFSPVILLALRFNIAGF